VRDQDLFETQEATPYAAHEQRRFGERFLVEALVASGGMGMVFRGRDILDGQPVALKVLRRHGHNPTERFFREAEALAALSHPAIVRYVAHGTTPQGEPYLVMEWLDGETLADRLFRGAIGPVAAARLGSRVLQALAVRNLRVPNDVSVVSALTTSHDAERMMPSLTSADVPSHALARLAVSQLIRTLDQPSAGLETVLLPCPLTVRESTTFKSGALTTGLRGWGGATDDLAQSQTGHSYPGSGLAWAHIGLGGR